MSIDKFNNEFLINNILKLTPQTGIKPSFKGEELNQTLSKLQTTLFNRSEREVPENGDFSPISEEFNHENSSYKLTLKHSKNTSVKDNLHLIELSIQNQSKTEEKTIPLLEGTKQDILEFLKSPNFIEKGKQIISENKVTQESRMPSSMSLQAQFLPKQSTIQKPRSELLKDIEQAFSSQNIELEGDIEEASKDWSKDRLQELATQMPNIIENFMGLDEGESFPIEDIFEGFNDWSKEELQYISTTLVPIALGMKNNSFHMDDPMGETHDFAKLKPEVQEKLLKVINFYNQKGEWFIFKNLLEMQDVPEENLDSLFKIGNSLELCSPHTLKKFGEDKEVLAQILTLNDTINANGIKNNFILDFTEFEKEDLEKFNSILPDLLQTLDENGINFKSDINREGIKLIAKKIQNCKIENLDIIKQNLPAWVDIFSEEESNSDKKKTHLNPFHIEVLLEADTDSVKEFFSQIKDIKEIIDNNQTKTKYSVDLADMDITYLVKAKPETLKHIPAILKTLDDNNIIIDRYLLEKFTYFTEQEAIDFVNEMPEVLSVFEKNGINQVISVFKPIQYMPGLINNLSNIYSNEDKDTIIKFANKRMNETLSEIKLYPLSEQLHILHTIGATKDFKINRIETVSDIFPAYSKIENEIIEGLKHTITPTTISKENEKAMFSEFFTNENPQVENAIKNFDFSKYQKDGLPLEYSRKDFVSDLTEKLNLLEIDEKDEILRKLEIKLSNDGYNGVIRLDKLEENGVEGEIKTLATKFIKENTVKTHNPQIDKALNTLIQGMPEFINIIGKPQDGNELYSTDIKTLKVLQDCLNNKDYDTLSNLEKTYLKFGAILYNISQEEGEKGQASSEISALYARNILEKYNLPIELKDRIFELIKHNDWLEHYEEKGMSPNYIAAIFRHNKDLKLAELITKGILNNSPSEYQEKYSDRISPQNLQPIQNALKTINENGNMIFTSKIQGPKGYNAIPEVEYKGETYKVIDFKNLPNEQIKEIFGQENKDDIRFLIHALVADNDVFNTDKANTVMYLGDIAREGHLCSSFVKPDNCKTILGINYGLILETENNNIANAYYTDQWSGYQKDFNEFAKILSGDTSSFMESPHVSKDFDKNGYRSYLPDKIKSKLGLNNKEYSLLYSQISKHKFLSQIQDDKLYFIGQKEILGKDIKEAITYAQDSLINDKHQNEANLFNPKAKGVFAKADKIEDLPQELLDFAKENELPIYLFKKD